MGGTHSSPIYCRFWFAHHRYAVGFRSPDLALIMSFDFFFVTICRVWGALLVRPAGRKRPRRMRNHRVSTERRLEMQGGGDGGLGGSYRRRWKRACGRSSVSRWIARVLRWERSGGWWYGKGGLRGAKSNQGTSSRHCVRLFVLFSRCSYAYYMLSVCVVLGL